MCNCGKSAGRIGKQRVHRVVLKAGGHEDFLTSGEARVFAKANGGVYTPTWIDKPA